MRDHDHDDIQDNIEPTGEESVDGPELETEEATSNDKLKELRAKLKACEADKRKNLEDLQRTKADFLNSRKRLEDERIRDKERLTNQHVEQLLPLCDSFAMAMGNSAVWQSVDKEWRQGVEGIYNQLKSLLNSYQVTELNPIGETFDPNRHEAMGTKPAADTESETILEVIQSGYERNGTIIRPAKVIISE